MEDKYYFYDYKYWTLEEISEMYNKLPCEKRKLFRDSIAHYTLAEILKKSDYDRSIIHTVWEIAGEEVDHMNLIGTDCGRPLLGLDRRYKSQLIKLFYLSGEFVFNDDDIRINNFSNGEYFLNSLVCFTIGSTYEKDIVGDLFLLDYNSLSKEECLAISDNFMRFMKNEELVLYNENKHLKK